MQDHKVLFEQINSTDMYYTPREIQLLSQALRKHCTNIIKEVADHSGVAYPTVVKFFKFEKVRNSKAEQIYQGALGLIEVSAQRKSQDVAKAKKYAE